MLIETRYEKCDECLRTAPRLFAGHCLACVSTQLNMSAGVTSISDHRVGEAVTLLDTACEQVESIKHILRNIKTDDTMYPYAWSAECDDVIKIFAQIEHILTEGE